VKETMIVFVNWVRFIFRANKWLQFYNRVTQSFHTPSEGWILKTKSKSKLLTAIGPLQDPITWYGINYAGTQVTQWDFQNKGKLGWTGTSSFVLEVPLCGLRPGVVDSVPCDRIVQRVYFEWNMSLSCLVTWWILGQEQLLVVQNAPLGWWGGFCPWWYLPRSHRYHNTYSSRKKNSVQTVNVCTTCFCESKFQLSSAI